MAYSVLDNKKSGLSTTTENVVYSGTYRGFSTVSGAKNNQLYDLDLVKQDLINHFYTRKGERVMNPEFGTIIWDMIYEPLDEANKEIIIEDCRQVIASDPRVELESISLSEVESGLRINININILPFNQSSTMTLNFERETL